MLKRLGAVAVALSGLAGGALAVGAHVYGAGRARSCRLHGPRVGNLHLYRRAGWPGGPVAAADGAVRSALFRDRAQPQQRQDWPRGNPRTQSDRAHGNAGLVFYSATEQTVRASVTFHQGIISEWYPQASVPPVAPVPAMSNALGRIQWNDVRIRPGAKEDYPVEPGESHYYAARATDAAPLLVGGQQEKFLFYRGLATFPLLVGATVNRDGNIVLTQTGDRAIDTVILFERRAGRFGYRLVRAAGKDVVIDRPVLNATMESMRQELQSLLIEKGLYPREAAAMVETWRDSWFEDGARLFYLLPQYATDALLPLTDRAETGERRAGVRRPAGDRHARDGVRGRDRHSGQRPRGAA